MAMVTSRVVDALIPVTMVGSYPRPRWYTRRSNGMDMREFWMDQNTREEYEDAVKAVIKDQEMAGLDIVSDGEMYEDDLVGAIGWPEYVTARIGGMHGRGDPPMAALLSNPSPIIADMMEHWPGRIITERVTRGPLRFADLYRRAQRITPRPVKASFVDPQFVLAASVNDQYYGSKPGQPSPDLLMDLAAIYNAELRELAAAGCRVYQSDLPPFAELGIYSAPQPAWDVAARVFNAMVDGTGGMQIWMHYCWGRPAGQRADDWYGPVGPDFRPMFPQVFDANFHVLNIECGDCLGPEMGLLEQVPRDRSVAIGIINHRVLQVETAEQVADKIRRALQHISPERLFVTTFCGLGTTLPRTIAFFKLKALVDGTNIVRAELKGTSVEEEREHTQALAAGV
jgi:5-methyltetrahydropteroyltriglutamate--homocysteine methyltransferase